MPGEDRTALTAEQIRDLRREQRLDNELADAIERAWRSKFGDPSVIAEVEIARIRSRLR